jgi:hypothetical protein
MARVLLCLLALSLRPGGYWSLPWRSIQSGDDLIAFGGISPMSEEVQTSERIRVQENADVTQMERTQHLTEKKNKGSSGTTSKSKFSSCSR